VRTQPRWGCIKIPINSGERRKDQMEMKQVAWMAFVGMLTLAFVAFPCRVAAEDLPGFEFLDGIGTRFELPRFNVFITTDTTAHIYLRACSSEMISYYIESASDAVSTQLTLGYLKPFTTYYMYEDSYVNEKVFTTDDVGSYAYSQDLATLHCVFIQPRSGTMYISTSTTLQSDIYDDVAIIADNIVLNLNGYSIIGSGGWNSWIGLDVSYRRNVTIEGGGIRNQVVGIYLGTCRNIVVQNVTLSSNGWSDIEMAGVWYSSFIENNFQSPTGLECAWGSFGNTIYHNSFIGSSCWNSYAGPNSWDDGYPSGGNYWSYYAGSDLYNGPNQDIPGSDGIGDLPYGIGNEYDHYPLMNPYTPIEAVVKISGTDTPVMIGSNAVIGQIVANKNNLKFTSSGPTGTSGFVNLVLPMSVVSTSIQVSVDNKKLPSPFPVVNTNGTHYFIYFEFALSTHVVTVQFAPSVDAVVDIDPDTLNLKSQGEWITGYIEFAEEYSVNDIDVSTLMLNGTISAELSPTEIGDHDRDGLPDLMVKFNRTEVSQYICDVQKILYGNVTLTIKGELSDGTTVEGSDTIRVRMPGDTDCNGKVDVKDVGQEAKNYGNPTYDIKYDLNDDGVVDVRDVAMSCKNYGKTYQ